MNTNQNKQPLQFTGTGFEFFKIWIVNIMLSIVTLGIYSAWAKVRTRRYFYGNTQLMGTAFDYLADPMKILKGRLIAFTVFVIYSVVGSFAPAAQLGLMLLFIPIVPWVIIKALSFNAYNTAYRNIRFDFNANYLTALKVFVGLPLLVGLSAGLAYPYFVKARKQFIIDHSAYGSSPFELEVTVGAFYLIYFKAFIMYVVIGGIAMGLISLFSNDMDEMVTLIPEKTTMMSVFSLFVIPAFMLIFTYIYTSITNLVINQTQLQGHHFKSTLTVGKLCWIYFSNIVVIMFSFGLMIPWAMIRTTRYRISCLSVYIVGNPDEFIAAETKRAEAIGEEIGDMFDMDIGL